MLVKRYFLLSIVIFSLSVCPVFTQITIDEVASPASVKLNRNRGLNMLDEIKQLLKQRYYDKNYRGIDIEERFKIAKERVKTLNTNWQIFRAIAQVLFEFDDSHTRFYPPNRANRVEYGFTMQMIGQNCFVTDVKKGSDAEVKGLKTGDIIVGVGNFNPTRENLWVMNYVLYALDPQETLKVYVLNPDKTEREIEIKAVFKSIEERRREAEKRRKEKRENPYKCQKINAETIACKLYTFSIDKKYIDKMMKEVEGHRKLVLDLRGNGGGYVKIEEYLTGHFFDRDVKIADFVMRDKTKERIAKTQKGKVFGGDLIVLIDSNSASASEVFARVIQLEKRGKIVGDVSAGAVMTSNFITMANVRGAPGFETLSFFAMNITIADLIMSDGKRLEKVGVIPDYPVGPTGKALFDKTDPILAYSLGLLGANITEEEAGKFYFLTKKAEDEDEEESEETEN
jgi:C-terminal processing protease CtpA/Prc